jgi:hypothetical protein
LLKPSTDTDALSMVNLRQKIKAVAIAGDRRKRSLAVPPTYRLDKGLAATRCCVARTPGDNVPA